MASLTSSPASPPSPPSPQQQQQQQQEEGGDGDAIVHALEKLQCPSAAGSALHPENDNQDDEGKGPKEVHDEHDAPQQIAQSQPQHLALQTLQTHHQPQQPQLSLEKLENDRLKCENHALAHQVKDLVANYGRHVQSLQAQLQQQSASHDRAQREWQRQVHELRSAQVEATDSARRAQAQVQALEERLHQLEGPQYNNSTSPQPQSQPQQVPVEPLLRLTHQRQNQLQHPQASPSRTLHHPHAVQRSVVNAAPRASDSANVARHPQQPFSDASTVRATRIGRNRSAPSGGVAPQQSASGDGYSPPTPVNGATTRMTPPVNPFQWQNDINGYETTRSRYSGYSAPPAPVPAPTSVRPSTYYPPQNYSSSYSQQPTPPVGYPQPRQQQHQLSTSPIEPTLISICPIPNEAVDSQAQPTGSGRPGLEKKPSSGLLAFCSELLSSTLAPVASVASVAPSIGDNNTAAVTSPNARVTPAWQLFSSSNSSSSNSQLTKQSSLDVEQGFSPPRAHQIPHKQHGYPNNFSGYSNHSYSYHDHQQHGHPNNTPPALPQPPPREQADSALPMHSSFGHF